MASDRLARESISCPLCGSDRHALHALVPPRPRGGVILHGTFVAAQGREQVVRCCSCGMLFVNPRLVAQPGLQTYSAVDEAAYFERTRADRWAGNARMLARLEILAHGTGRLLDVGCGDGLLLQQARQQGWDAWGLEVSADLVASLREEGLSERVFQGTLDEARYPTGRFDVVTLINVVEHLRDPRPVMVEAARVVRPGGLVVVHTPNARSLGALLRGPGWHHYEPFDHLCYFTMGTLRRLFYACQIDVVGSVALPGRSPLKRALLTLSQALGLHLDNGLGLVGRKRDAL